MRRFHARTFFAGLILCLVAFTACVTGPSIDPQRLKGIVLDDTQGERRGPWVEVSTNDVRHLGVGFLQDNDANKGEVSLVYTPDIPENGDYEIILISPPHENRARNVPVTIAVQNLARVTLSVDQRTKANKGFARLGTFRLPKGKLTTVTVSNAGTKGFVVADGIQFVPVKKRGFQGQKK
ncbi:MAG: hypothetical protein HY298_10565 [Verrucomicrobia bacterium]|nr:hypothetical protein [Verrucomicrobiota bacterium]